VQAHRRRRSQAQPNAATATATGTGRTGAAACGMSWMHLHAPGLWAALVPSSRPDFFNCPGQLSSSDRDGHELRSPANPPKWLPRRGKCRGGAGRWGGVCAFSARAVGARNYKPSVLRVRCRRRCLPPPAPARPRAKPTAGCPSGLRAVETRAGALRAARRMHGVAGICVWRRLTRISSAGWRSTGRRS